MKAEVYLEMAAVHENHWWFTARRRIIAAVIRSLALPARAEILEIGCGTGGNLAMLAEFGRLQAMELDETARNFASSLGVCNVIHGGLPETIPFDNGSFDLVCLLDVLEHVESDTVALARVSRLLKPSGKILVTVPAYSWLWSGHDTVHKHYRRYTASMLRNTAEGAGLTVLRLGYFNTLLFPLVAVKRLLQNVSKNKTETSDAWLPPLLLNFVLDKMFGMERCFVNFRLFPFGSSVLAVLASSACYSFPGGNKHPEDD